MNIDFYNQYEEYLRKRKKSCYFCDFHIVHGHHIFPRHAGGSNIRENIIFLCPNHHALLHERKHVLKFIIDRGWYTIMRFSDEKIICLPADNYKIYSLIPNPHLKKYD